MIHDTTDIDSYISAACPIVPYLIVPYLIVPYLIVPYIIVHYSAVSHSYISAACPIVPYLVALAVVSLSGGDRVSQYYDILKLYTIRYYIL